MILGRRPTNADFQSAHFRMSIGEFRIHGRPATPLKAGTNAV